MYKVTGLKNGVPDFAVYKTKAAALRFANTLTESEVYCTVTNRYIHGTSRFYRLLNESRRDKVIKMALENFKERELFPHFQFYATDEVLAQLVFKRKEVIGIEDFNEGDKLSLENGTIVRHCGMYFELHGTDDVIVNFHGTRLPKDLAETVQYIIDSGINRNN